MASGATKKDGPRRRPGNGLLRIVNVDRPSPTKIIFHYEIEDADGEVVYEDSWEFDGPPPDREEIARMMTTHAKKLLLAFRAESHFAPGDELAL